MKTDPKTYILHLTVEEFIEVLKDNLPQTQAAPQSDPDLDQPQDGPTFTGRIIYGVNGIERFFNISHKPPASGRRPGSSPPSSRKAARL